MTFAPRSWAASTTRRISAAVHGDAVRIRAVEVELQEVGAVVELADRVRQQLVGGIGRDGVVAGGRLPRLSSQVPAARMYGKPAAACPAVANAEAQRPTPTVDRVLDVRRPDVARPADARRRSAARRSAPRPRRASTGGSSIRSIQWAPPGRVTWLWQSTMPGTMVAPLASTTSRPSAGPRSPSSSVGRIQRIETAVHEDAHADLQRSDRPSAMAPSRYSTRAGPATACDGRRWRPATRTREPTATASGRRGSVAAEVADAAGEIDGTGWSAQAASVTAAPQARNVRRERDAARGRRREPGSSACIGSPGSVAPGYDAAMLAQDVPQDRRAAALPAARRAVAAPAPPRFSAALGGGIDVWIKREDLLPLAFGGNKLRNLEFLVGAALAEGADTLVTSGRRWSNHCRLTAAAGARAGLDVHLVLSGPPLDEPGPTSASTRCSGRPSTSRRPTSGRSGRRSSSGSPSTCGGPGSGRSSSVSVEGPVGAAGQVLAALEAIGQARAAGIEPAAIVLPSATGGTHAGLVVGSRLGVVRGAHRRRGGRRAIRGAQARDRGYARRPGAADRGTVDPAEIELTDDERGPGYGSDADADASGASPGPRASSSTRSTRRRHWRASRPAPATVAARPVVF